MQEGKKYNILGGAMKCCESDRGCKNGKARDSEIINYQRCSELGLLNYTLSYPSK